MEEVVTGIPVEVEDVMMVTRQFGEMRLF